MKKKYVVLGLFSIIFSTASLFSQTPYSLAAGLRLGNQIGLSGKLFVWEDNAIEAIIAGRTRGLDIHSLWEKYESPFNLDGLFLFYGGGAHMGFNTKSPANEGSNSGITLGLDGVLGLEYVLPVNVPLSISLDWKPELNFVSYTGLDFAVGALSVRYIFR